MYSENEGVSYCDYFPAVYDLRTGDKLSLKDIFAEGYPYEDVINRNVLEYLRKTNADDEMRGSEDGEYYEDYYWYFFDQY